MIYSYLFLCTLKPPITERQNNNRDRLSHQVTQIRLRRTQIEWRALAGNWIGKQVFPMALELLRPIWIPAPFSPGFLFCWNWICSASKTWKTRSKNDAVREFEKWSNRLQMRKSKMATEVTSRAYRQLLIVL